MRKLVLAAAAVVALASRPAAAQTIPSVPFANPAKVFVTVDAVFMAASFVDVTGVVQGDAVPSTWRAYFLNTTNSDQSAAAAYAANCQRAAFLAMSRPGQYLFELFSNGGSPPHPYCKLTRVP